MKRFAVVAVTSGLALNAFALGFKDNGDAWNSASGKEKDQVAREAVRRLGASYPAGEMRACLDSFYVPPAPKQILQQEIGQIMALCHTQLR